MNGTYKILYIYHVDDYYPIGCLTSNSFSEGVEVLDSTIRGNTGGWGTFTPTSQSYNISFSGILTLDDRGSTIVTYADLQGIKRNRTEVQWRIAMSDGEGDTDEGTGYITSLNQVASIDESISFDGEITGSGEPTTTTWTPPTYNDIIDMIPIYNAAKT